MSKYDLKNTDYQLFFPENLQKYKNLKSLSLELEKQLKKEVVSEVSKLAIFKNLELQSNEVLSELAYQYMIDNWQESLDRNIKIKLIKNAYWSHSKKGTKKIIEDNLIKLGYPLELYEWFEYGGAPFTFKIITSYINSEPNWINNIIEIIEKYKNCRSVLEYIEIEQNKPAMKMKVGHWQIKEIELHPKRTNDFNKYQRMKIARFRILEGEL